MKSGLNSDLSFIASVDDLKMKKTFILKILKGDIFEKTFFIIFFISFVNDLFDNLYRGKIILELFFDQSCFKSPEAIHRKLEKF